MWSFPRVFLIQSNCHINSTLKNHAGFQAPSAGWLMRCWPNSATQGSWRASGDSEGRSELQLQCKVSRKVLPSKQNVILQEQGSCFELCRLQEGWGLHLSWRKLVPTVKHHHVILVFPGLCFLSSRASLLLALLWRTSANTWQSVSGDSGLLIWQTVLCRWLCHLSQTTGLGSLSCLSRPLDLSSLF